MKRFAAACLVLLAIGATGCDRGDHAGAVERVAREAFDGWDMWETAAVQPHERPMPFPVDGTVPVTGSVGFDEARLQLAALNPAVREERPALVYRRYCYHCHGPNGDGRIIVGESFGVKPGDLRSPEIQSRSDQELFDVITNGSEFVLPLAGIVTPVDRLLAIEHVRTLAGAPSTPFFEPRNTKPLE